MANFAAFFTPLLIISACTTPGPGSGPDPKAFSPRLTLFSYQGYQFAGQVQDGQLRVKVPCCQTYLADAAFRKLMLEAVEQRLGCAPARPEFTPGWIGTWQLEAQFACKVETNVDAIWQELSK